MGVRCVPCIQLHLHFPVGDVRASDGVACIWTAMCLCTVPGFEQGEPRLALFCASQPPSIWTLALRMLPRLRRGRGSGHHEVCKAAASVAIWTLDALNHASATMSVKDAVVVQCSPIPRGDTRREPSRPRKSRNEVLKHVLHRTVSLGSYMGTSGETHCNEGPR